MFVFATLISLMQVATVQREVFRDVRTDTATIRQITTAPPCFDVQEVIANCTPVYVRLNFHLFVNDNCTGSFDVNNIAADWPQEGAYAEDNQRFNHGIAERMVYEINQLLENNHPQKLPGGMYATTAPCVPLRFALGAVLVHCDKKFRDQQSWRDYENKYGKYAPPGINIYYSRHTGGASGEAETFGPGILIGYPSATLILHEIGHALSLAHTFSGDGCADTPDDGFNWDKNCDGDFYDMKESRWPCGELLPAGSDWCSGVKCQISPCCDSNNIYNNFMGYNPSQNAITACQIEKMMTTLSTRYPCEYFVQIGGDCPPPEPILGTLPLELTATDCFFCLQGAASINDDAYQLSIQAIGNPLDTVPFYRTEWQGGPVGKFCFYTLQNATQTLHPIQANTQYQAILTVKNTCEKTAETIYSFTTPDFQCHEMAGQLPHIAPNPARDSVMMSLEVPAKGPVCVIANGLANQEAPRILWQEPNQKAGPFALEFSVSSWLPGIYSIRFISDSGSIEQGFIKQ